MGWARNWGPLHAASAARVENAIRIGIPALAFGTFYVGHEIGDELWDLLNGEGDQQMTAVCVRCGAIKPLPYETCIDCGFQPEHDSEDLVKSVYLSTGRYDSPTDQTRYEAELRHMSQQIAKGIDLAYDENDLMRLRAQKAEVECVDERAAVRYVFRILFPGFVFILILAGILIALKQL
jgi:hypothetical protein